MNGSQFLGVCLGGAFGTGARYLLSTGLLRLFGAGFPYGTLAVNLIGSFLVALLTVVGIEGTALSPTMRLVLTTGVMGGFTTYSAFSLETLQFLQAGAHAAALGYVAATLLGCLLMCWLGWQCGRWLVLP
jgi:CrcB protein